MVLFGDLIIIQYIFLGVAGGVISCVHGNITRNDDLTVLGTLETAIVGGFSAYVVVGIIPHFFPSTEKYLSPLSAISGFLGRNLLSGLQEVFDIRKYVRVKIGALTVERKEDGKRKERENDKV